MFGSYLIHQGRACHMMTFGARWNAREMRDVPALAEPGCTHLDWKQGRNKVVVKKRDRAGVDLHILERAIDIECVSICWT